MQHIDKSLNQIHILGSGAVGCLWASALHYSKKNCFLLLRNQQSLDTLRRNKLHYQSLLNTNSSFSFLPKAAIAKKYTDPIGVLLVTTKSYDTVNALASIKSTISEHTAIILFQNGLGTQQQIAEDFPSNTIICAVSSEGVFRNAPFNINHAGSGKTILGIYNAPKDGSDSIDQYQNSIANKMLKITTVSNINEILWNKLLINCAINAYTVIYQCRNGELLDNTQAMIRIKLCCNELTAITRAVNIEYYSDKLFESVIDVLTKTAKNKSSMLQDIERGQQTEIDYINGYIIKVATKFNINCKENISIYNAIKTYQKKLKQLQ